MTGLFYCCSNGIRYSLLIDLSLKRLLLCVPDSEARSILKMASKREGISVLLILHVAWCTWRRIGLELWPTRISCRKYHVSDRSTLWKWALAQFSCPCFHWWCLLNYLPFPALHLPDGLRRWGSWWRDRRWPKFLCYLPHPRRSGFPKCKRTWSVRRFYYSLPVLPSARRDYRDRGYHWYRWV